MYRECPAAKNGRMNAVRRTKAESPSTTDNRECPSQRAQSHVQNEPIAEQEGTPSATTGQGITGNQQGQQWVRTKNKEQSLTLLLLCAASSHFTFTGDTDRARSLPSHAFCRPAPQNRRSTRRHAPSSSTHTSCHRREQRQASAWTYFNVTTR